MNQLKNTFRNGQEPTHPCTPIIGRDASEVTKRNVPHFPVELKSTRTPHIAWHRNIVRMPGGYLVGGVK